MTSSITTASGTKLQKTRDQAVMREIYARGDRIMRTFLLFHAALALALAWFYGTWLVTLAVGGAAIGMFFVSATLLPGSFLTRCISGVSLQTFVALHIYQMHGLAEMHFFYFTAFTLMIVYQDWISMWPGALLIIGQHILFAALTNSGRQMYFFEDPYIGPTKLFFHFGIAIAQTSLCGYWAFLLRRQTLRDHAQQEALKHRADRQELFNRIYEIMRSSLDPDVIQQVAVTELGRTLKANSCYFSMFDLDRDLAWVGQDWRSDGVSSQTGQYRISDQPMALEQFGGGKTVIVNSENDLLSEAVYFRLQTLGHTAVIKAPLFEGERLMAVLTVAMTKSARTWTPEEVLLTEAVAIQTRLAVETARVRQRESLVATTLQEALRPHSPDRAPGLSLSTFYQPALTESSIGGDFFDVFSLAEGRTALVVGDVSGKGLAAAAQVATVRNMLRYALYEGHTFAEALSSLNRTISNYDLLRGFSTLFVGRYDPVARTLTYVSCGHEPGLLRRAASGLVEELPPTGTVLGADAEAQFEEVVIPMAEGDVLAIYTDGITDSGPSVPEFLGTSGLGRLLAEAADMTEAEALRQHLVTSVERYAAGHLRDDACLLVAVAERPILHLASTPNVVQSLAGAALLHAA